MKKRWMAMLTVIAVLACTLMGCMQTQAPKDKDKNEEQNKEIQLDSNKVYSYMTLSDGGTLSKVTNSLPTEWFAGSEKYQDKKAAATFSADIFGKKITLDYSFSIQWDHYGHNKRVTYHAYGGAIVGEVRVDAESGKIIYYHDETPPPGMIDTVLKSDENLNRIYDLPKDEIRAIAEDYAKKLVGEEQFKKYECVFESNRIVFYRVVNGYKTVEYVAIYLTSAGDLYSYNLSNIGMYDNVSAFKFDEKKAEAEIQKQLDAYYKEKGKEYGIDEMVPTPMVLPNGQLGYEYKVTTAYVWSEEIINGESSQLLMSHSFTFVIPA